MKVHLHILVKPCTSKKENTVNVLKFQTLSTSCFQRKSRIHKIVVKVANREDPDQTASTESSLIWVCTVCLGLLGWQLVFDISEHL